MTGKFGVKATRRLIASQSLSPDIHLQHWTPLGDNGADSPVRPQKPKLLGRNHPPVSDSTLALPPPCWANPPTADKKPSLRASCLASQRGPTHGRICGESGGARQAVACSTWPSWKPVSPWNGLWHVRFGWFWEGGGRLKIYRGVFCRNEVCNVSIFTGRREPFRTSGPWWGCYEALFQFVFSYSPTYWLALQQPPGPLKPGPHRNGVFPIWSLSLKIRLFPEMVSSTWKQTTTQNAVVTRVANEHKPRI